MLSQIKESFDKLDREWHWLEIENTSSLAVTRREDDLWMALKGKFKMR